MSLHDQIELIERVKWALRERNYSEVDVNRFQAAAERFNTSEAMLETIYSDVTGSVFNLEAALDDMGAHRWRLITQRAT